MNSRYDITIILDQRKLLFLSFPVEIRKIPKDHDCLYQHGLYMVNLDETGITKIVDTQYNESDPHWR